MPLQIVRNDITRMRVDAIVNAARNSLLGAAGDSGSVDGAIHRAAGPKLLEECRKLGGCAVGQAKLTHGHDLPCKYVVHTVGPRWVDGAHGERDALASCYREALRVAAEAGCRSIAFPLIAAGTLGFPEGLALEIAEREIDAFLRTRDDMSVSLVVFDKKAFLLSREKFDTIRQWIDDRYVENQLAGRRNRRREEAVCWLQDHLSISTWQDVFDSARRRQGVTDAEEAEADRDVSVSQQRAALPRATEGRGDTKKMPAAPGGAKPALSLGESLKRLEEGFSQRLLKKIRESGMTEVECYQRANVDRKHFSKIRSNPCYKPKKPTVLAFAVALRLTVPETRELLEAAGYALSRSEKSDLIVEYFLESKDYDINHVNKALFDFGQQLLGAG